MDKQIILSSNTEAVERALDKRNCSLLEIANAFKTVALEWGYLTNKPIPEHSLDAD